MNTKELSNLIKTEALNLGFDKVGIAEACATEKERIHLEDWISRGYQGTMAWIEKRQAERGDILTYFPEARSVISVAMNYFTGTSREIVARGTGEFHFSNYAWGNDYHEFLKSRLKSLAKIIKEVVPECKGVFCVDTSPVIEKGWAQKAGIGWQGKHTNIITRDSGSWIFLGELIVDIDLEPDLPFDQDLCGTCTACLDACPTQALNEYLLDANKCISYKTIEFRGEFSSDDSTHGWVFGCDICQEVCPWNIKFASRSSNPEFKARKEIRNWNTEEWIKNIPDSFNRIFKGSAVKRTKVSGLLRNFKALGKGGN